MGRVKKVLFVCTANTCLSNMAAAVFEGVRGGREIHIRRISAKLKVYPKKERNNCPPT